MKQRVFRGIIFLALTFSVSVSAYAARMLVPVGKVVGLRISEGSVTVVAFDNTLGQSAIAAGMQIGDDIQKIDDIPIDCAQDLHNALSHSDGRVRVTLERRGRAHEILVDPSVTTQGPRLGVFVREGISGIGTVTYYDPESGSFGALGHGISNQQGKLAEMQGGSIYPATVSSVRQGQAGRPGQLGGALKSTQAIGQLRTNCARGVFGSCEEFTGQVLPVGSAQVGPARILSNISGEAVEAFSVEILKVCGPENENGRDMVIKVTDEALLNATGGIVAGMSGSPIIQDGKLVGAVTHVLVNSPDTGYGIFIENMLDAAA